MLREKVIKGGLALSFRSGATALLSLLTTVLLARMISPEGYGTYALIQAITIFLAGLGPASLKTYLIRLPYDPSEEELRVSFSLTTAIGVITSLISLAVVGWVDWHYKRGLAGMFMLGLAGFNVSLVSFIPLALLERGLDYKKISAMEVISKSISSIASLGLAYKGYGVYAILYSELLSNIFIVVFSFYYKPVRIGFSFKPEIVRRVAKYASSFSIVGVIWSLKGLATSSLLAGLVSLEALGYIKIAQAVLNRLSFLQEIIWRVSMSALAKVEDRSKLVDLVGEGLMYSFLFTAPLYFLVAGTSYWFMPRFFGSQWAPTSTIILIGALAASIVTVFNPMENLFVVKGYNSVLIKYQTLLLVTSCLCLVPAARIFKGLGLPIAETVACSCYVYLYIKFKELFGPIRLEKTAFLLVASYICSLVAYLLGNIFYSAALLLVANSVLLLGNRDMRSLLLGAFRLALK